MKQNWLLRLSSTSDSSGDLSKPLQWRPASSRSAVADRIDSLRLVTWNIWFDKLEQNTRYSSVLKELISIPSVDVIALQEVTSAFLEMIQADITIQRDWLLTDYRDANHRQQTARIGTGIFSSYGGNGLEIFEGGS